MTEDDKKRRVDDAESLIGVKLLPMQRHIMMELMGNDTFTLTPARLVPINGYKILMLEHKE